MKAWRRYLLARAETGEVSSPCHRSPQRKTSQSPGRAAGSQTVGNVSTHSAKKLTLKSGGDEILQITFPPSKHTSVEGISYPFSISLRYSATYTILPADAGYKLISNH